MTEVQIPATDPRALIATFSAVAKTAPDRAKVAGELAALMNAYNSGITDHQGLLNAIVDFDSTYKRESTGNGALDPVNLGLDFMQLIKFGGDAVSTIEKAADTDKVYSLGGTILSAHTTAMDVVDSLPVQAIISDHRARAGADFVDDYTENALASFNGNVAQAMQIANTDPEFLRAMKAQFPLVFVDPDQTVITSGGCVTDHPEIFNQVTNNTIIVRPDNSVLINDIDSTRQDILTAVTGLGDDVHGGILSIQGELGTIADQNKSIANGVDGIAIFLQDEAASKAKQATAEAARGRIEATMTATWTAAEGTVSGIAGIAILLGDPKLAGDIQKFGTGLVNLAKCVVTFANAMTAITAGLNVLSAFGTAAATGNLIGAVASLVTLLLPTEPTPEEQILTEIGHIEDALSTISTQIADGFNHIEEQLTTIYTSVMGTLSQISATVVVTLEEVETIRHLLVDQTRQLGELSIEIATWFKAAERASLEQDINTGLGWAANNAAPMSDASFAEFTGHFYDWAVTRSYDEINQPLNGRQFDLASVGTELAGDLYDNVSYLNLYLTSSGRPGLTDLATAEAGSAPLPNLQMWSLAAAAFAQINAEWAELALLTDVRFDQISVIGADFRQRIQELARNRNLFPAIIKDYEKANTNLGDSLNTFRVKFQHETLPQRLGFAMGDTTITADVDLTKPFTQPFSWSVPFPTAHSVAPGEPDLVAPDGMHAVVPALYLLADFLNPGKRQLTCIWQATQTKRTVTRLNPITHQQEDHTVWDVRAAGNVQYAGSTVGGLVVTVASSLNSAMANAAGFVAGNWTAGTNVLAQLNQLSRSSHPVVAPPATVQAATDAANAGLLQAASWFADMATAEMATGGDCASAAQSLQGTWYVIENLVRLLFPGPRAGDDAFRSVFGSSPTAGGIGLPDIGIVADTLAEPVKQKALGSGYPDLNLRLSEIAVVPLTVLQGRVTAWQDALTAGTFTNALVDLEDPLLRLANTVHIVQWRPQLEAVVALAQTATKNIQGIVHAPVTGSWDASTGSAAGLVQDAAHNRAFPDVKALQRAVGAVADGVWGPKSRAALTACVTSLQRVLKVVPDGDWGAITELRYNDYLSFELASAAG